MSPTPQGNGLDAVLAFADDDVWFGGQDALLHYDGRTVSFMTDPAASVNVRALWGSGPADVWADGDRMLVHWDGSHLVRIDTKTDARLSAIFGNGDGTVSVAVEGGGLLHVKPPEHGEPATVSVVAPPAGLRNTVSARSLAAGDTWGLTKDNKVWQLAGTTVRTWALPVDGSASVAADILPLRDDDVWVAESERAVAMVPNVPLFHFDGSTWSAVPGAPRDSLRALAATSDHDLYAVGRAVHHFDGTRWTDLSRDVEALGVCALAPHDAWVVGERGLIARTGPDNLISGTDDAIDRSQDESFVTIWVAPPPSSDTWIGGRGGLWRYDGHAVTRMKTPLGRREIRAVWGSAADDVWAVGYKALLHWDGSRFTTLTPPVDMLKAVAGSGPSDVWIGGDGPMLAHWDGRSFTRAELDAGPRDGTVDGVWSDGARDVWAIGSEGAIWHWDGTSWSRSAGVVSGELRRVWGFGPADVWVFGDRGVEHFDGTRWSATDVAPLGARTASGRWGIALSGLQRDTGSGFAPVPVPFALDGCFDDGHGGVWLNEGYGLLHHG